MFSAFDTLNEDYTLIGARTIEKSKSYKPVMRLSERILRNIVNAYRLVYQGNFSIQDALQKIEDQVPMSDEIHNIINFIRNSKGIVSSAILSTKPLTTKSTTFR